MGSVSALRLCPHASLSTEELLNGKRNKHLSPVTGRQGETFFQPACPLSYSISLLPGIAFEARRGVNDFLDLSKVKERLFLWVQLWRVTVNLGYALRYGIRLLLLLLLPLLLRQLHCRLLSMIRHGTIKKNTISQTVRVDIMCWDGDMESPSRNGRDNWSARERIVRLPYHCQERRTGKLQLSSLG